MICKIYSIETLMKGRAARHVFFNRNWEWQLDRMWIEINKDVDDDM